jgi:hypothetical protein
LAAVVVGTYVVSPERVYVNARLIEPSTSLILSAGSVEMSKTRELTKMLRGGSMPNSLERIPVKHLGYASEANSMEAMRRKWMMEESDMGGLSNSYGASPAIPAPPAPPVTNDPAAVTSKPTTPKVLPESEPKPLEKAELAIGLGR